ncbi:hypothetical protein [Terribacillus saccharophilus]|uniref:Uncharacterized protein n=1 Tax=Terribacillus saccharophilus TaxID=361277 RepID=A0ABX4H3R5_9BACI|nr:hypothetical protein [Terribacillus saccharophilus]PAD34131.1 hypothetical protein CHH56_15755 [Terribacillus saccharophilus]PAD98015.1 hypothetical protein CHH50_00115 [Terribacillus saccharophilus]PAE01791.1 hypothetical protein CHH48_00115 [Terribacillus saccharophilus]
MIINKGGVLSEEYFISYLRLVKNSLNCSNDEAYNITFARLFKNDPDSLGKKSYETFQQAFILFNLMKELSNDAVKMS